MMQKYQKQKKVSTFFNYHKFTNNILYVKTQEKKLVNESDISGFINNSY